LRRDMDAIWRPGSQAARGRIGPVRLRRDMDAIWRPGSQAARGRIGPPYAYAA
jgi:hypothetical protein